MRNFATVALIIILAMFSPMSVASMQEPAPPGPFPCGEMEFKDVIALLADYDVIHQVAIDANRKWGITDNQERKIYISDRPATSMRQVIVLHELLHAFCDSRGIDSGSPAAEHDVHAKAYEIWHKLFGVKN
jgi:hypothetical protein